MGCSGRRRVGFACASVLAAACSSEGRDEKEREGGAEKPSSIEVGASSDLTFEITESVNLVVEPGDFAAAGTIATGDP
jgi:hypothetical protein